MIDRNILVGAREIAGYFFGDPDRARSVYRLLDTVNEPHRFPMFRLGGTICARKSEIDRWVEERERAANDDRREASNAA